MNKTYPLESYKFPTNGLNPLMLEVRPSQQNALESISEGQFFREIMTTYITNFGNERFEGTGEKFREMLKTKLAAPDQKLKFQIDDLSEKTKDNLIELFKPKF
jgi:hypothetical protein